MRTFQLPSADGKNKIMVYLWEPEGNVKAVLQISHGMQEHMKRYDAFATYLCERQIAVIGNDHLGHGQSAKTPDDLGYFCKEKASETVVKDLHQVTVYAKEQFPNVPVFLLGHSMGSFLARRYMETFGDELKAAVISGTGSMPSLVLSFGKFLCKWIEAVKGDHHRSKLIQTIAFGGYLKKIPSPRTESDWLCKDEAIVDAYRADPFCTFRFTVNGYHTLFDTMQFMQQSGNIQKIPKSLPVLFVSGDMDPVGDYGKGVMKAAEDMKKAGIKEIKTRIFPGDRHEVLNELDREVAYKEIFQWITSFL